MHHTCKVNLSGWAAARRNGCDTLLPEDFGAAWLYFSRVSELHNMGGENHAPGLCCPAQEGASVPCRLEGALAS